jgi:hypothetical protein
VGHCVYCGCAQDLSREHIIPLGLYGGFILPDASCAKCRKTTGKFEQHCMEGMFGLARERLRMASNRHKQNRKKFYINKTIKGVRKKVAAKTEELPSYMVLPLFWTPSTLLINKIISIPLTIHGHAFYQIQDNSTELLHMHGPFSIDIPYNLESFARMLAKIAHCLAVGELGQEILTHAFSI